MTVRPAGRIVTLVVAFVVVLTITGSASASTRAAGSACSLLRKVEVEKVIRVDVEKGAKPVAPPDVRVCAYDVVGDPGRSVHLWVQTGDDAKPGFAMAKAVFEDDVERVSGFGKRAFYVGGGLNTLYVLKGSTLLYVQYVAPDSGAPTEVKRAVAAMTKIVLRRL